MQQQNEALARYYSKKKKLKKRRKVAFFTLLVILSIVVVTVLSLTVFFNIDSITVEGGNYYTAEQIITVSGLEKGQNLFRLNKFKIIKKLQNELPYLDEVKINRKLLGKIGIVITVTETRPFMYVDSGDSFCLVDHELKVLEHVGVEPIGLSSVIGISPATDDAGATLTDENGAERHLMQLTPVLYQYFGDGRITQIDLTAVYDIKVLYEDRVTIEFGTLENIEKKIQLAKHVLDNNSKSEHAELDVSSGYRAYYKAID